MSEGTPDLPQFVPVLASEAIAAPAAAGSHEYDLSRTPPEKQAAIARALAGKLPLVDICRMFACSPHTVYAVRDQRPDLVASSKENLAHLGAKFAMVSESCLEEFTKDLIAGAVLPREKSFAAKLFADAALPLMGQPTAIVEHKKGKSASELAAKLAQVRAQIVDVEEVKP